MSAAAEAIPVLPAKEEPPENPTVIEIGEISDERRSAVAATLARILVGQALVELGVSPANDNGTPG